MTVDWDEGNYLENSFIMAYKHARFLKLWLDSYHDYRSDEWYFNGGIYPTDKYLKKNPELVHRVTDEFAATLCPLVYSEYSPKWRDYYAIHLLIRGNEIVPHIRHWCFNANMPNGTVYQFNDEIAPKLNVTFGEMTQTLYEFEKNIN